MPVSLERQRREQIQNYPHTTSVLQVNMKSREVGLILEACIMVRYNLCMLKSVSTPLGDISHIVIGRHLVLVRQKGLKDFPLP